MIKQPNTAYGRIQSATIILSYALNISSKQEWSALWKEHRDIFNTIGDGDANYNAQEVVAHIQTCGIVIFLQRLRAKFPDPAWCIIASGLRAHFINLWGRQFHAFARRNVSFIDLGDIIDGETRLIR